MIPDGSPSERRQGAERLGRRAESIAAWYLRLKGYRILARRYRTPLGEIDLVAKRGQTLAFVEVKARTSQEQGSALETITPNKLRHLHYTAESFMHTHPQLPQWGRFDAIAIDLSTNSLEHIKNISL